jgi:hypothetical protein
VCFSPSREAGSSQSLGWVAAQEEGEGGQSRRQEDHGQQGDGHVSGQPGGALQAAVHHQTRRPHGRLLLVGQVLADQVAMRLVLAWQAGLQVHASICLCSRVGKKHLDLGEPEPRDKSLTM